MVFSTTTTSHVQIISKKQTENNSLLEPNNQSSSPNAKATKTRNVKLQTKQQNTKTNEVQTAEKCNAWVDTKDLFDTTNYLHNLPKRIVSNTEVDFEAVSSFLKAVYSQVIEVIEENATSTSFTDHDAYLATINKKQIIRTSTQQLDSKIVFFTFFTTGSGITPNLSSMLCIDQSSSNNQQTYSIKYKSIKVQLAQKPTCLYALNGFGKLFTVGFSNGDILFYEIKTEDSEEIIVAHSKTNGGGKIHRNKTVEHAPHTDIVTKIDNSDKTLVSTSLDGSIVVWSVLTGENSSNLHKEVQLRTNCNSGITALGLFPDSQIVTGYENGELFIFKNQTSAPKKLKSHREFINTISINPGYQVFASASRDGSIRVYNTVKEDFIYEFSRHNSVIFTCWLTNASFLSVDLESIAVFDFSETKQATSKPVGDEKFVVVESGNRKNDDKSVQDIFLIGGSLRILMGSDRFEKARVDEFSVLKSSNSFNLENLFL